MKKPVCVVLTLSLCISGCGALRRAAPLEGNKAVAQIDQAASLHTSITSMTPWEEIKEKLKPGFALSTGDALSKSIPTTLVRLDRILDILRLQLAVTPTIKKEAVTDSSAFATGSAPTASRNSTSETSSPALTEVAPPTGLVPSVPSVSSVTSPDSPADALLQYQTAANLLRDIAVLNAEVDNVTRRTGQDAFLARIQFSVMPLRHGLGYDVYANLSVFGATGAFDRTTGARLPGEILPVVPLVIPILSTDSVQATRRSTNSTAEREVGLALNLLRGFGGIGASLGRGQQNQNEAAGDDLESVVTVGRLSDNTIRIRMGADPLPGGGYGMVPRTFNVSAVVFLPKKATQLYYVSRLSMHHVVDGTELSTNRTPSYAEGIAAIVARNAQDFQLTPDVLKTPLDDYAYHGDFDSFSKKLDSLLVKKEEGSPLEVQRQKMYVWSQLIALNRQTRFANSVVDIPRPEAMVWPSDRQLVAYTSGDSAISVTLGMGSNLRKDAIDARLLLGTCEAASRGTKGATVRAKAEAAQAVVLPAGSCRPATATTFVQATTITASPDGRSIGLQFPTLKELTPIGSKAGFAPFGVRLAAMDPDRGGAREQTYVFSAERVEKASAEKSTEVAAAIVPESRVVTASESRRGRVAIVVQGADKADLKVRVHSSVTTFTDENLKPAQRKGVYWEVADGGRYIIGLENLSESAVIQIELVSLSDKSKKPTPLFTTELRVEQARKK